MLRVRPSFNYFTGTESVTQIGIQTLVCTENFRYKEFRYYVQFFNVSVLC